MAIDATRGGQHRALVPVWEGAAQVIGGHRPLPSVQVAPGPAEAAAEGEGGTAREGREDAAHRGYEAGLQPGRAHAALRAARSSRSRKRGSSSISATIRKTSTGGSEADRGRRTASFAVVTTASAPASRADPWAAANPSGRNARRSRKRAR